MMIMGCPLPFSSGEHALHCGIVMACGDDRCLVQLAAGTVRADRAAGCLLVPENGDTVLVAVPSSGTAWVLSVLQRRGSGEATVALPAQTAVAAEDMRLESRSLHLHGQDVSLSGAAVTVQGGLVHLCGGILTHTFGSVCTFARSVLEKIGRLQTACTKKRETVQELAEMQAGRMRLHVDSSVRLRAETVDMAAQKHLVLDAEHIKVG